MKKILFLLVLIAGGCAMTYAPPVTISPVVASQVSDKAATMTRAKRALIERGERIEHIDDDVIVTSMRNKKLTPAEADCGKTMGLDYLKDARTKTQLGYTVSVSGENLIVQANIQGEYKPGAVDQNITLTCVSRGVLEDDLLSAILTRPK